MNDFPNSEGPWTLSQKAGEFFELTSIGFSGLMENQLQRSEFTALKIAKLSFGNYSKTIVYFIYLITVNLPPHF